MHDLTPDLGLTCRDVLYWWDLVAAVGVLAGFTWIAATARDAAIWFSVVVVVAGVLGKLPVEQYCGV